MISKEFRENVHRSIFINDTIDRELFKKVAPEIIRLRLESSDPITLYFDSLGGSIFYAESILDLIKSPNQDNRRCKITSVVYGFAASAAADMLALGDYALAHPQAFILCHGTRQSRENITLEDIHSLADSLRETNENFALRLASRMFKRMVYHMIVLTPFSEKEQFMPFYNTTTDPKAFLNKLKSKISDKNQKIFDSANARQEKIGELINDVRSHINLQKNDSVEEEATLLKAIIDYEARRLGTSTTNLSRRDLNIIQDDFVQLKDFFYGRYRRNLEEIACEQGKLFLTSEEEKEWEAEAGESRQKYLLNKVAPRLNPLWYFVVSICRELQNGEHYISPRDAFWLGLVDEVVGSDLQCLRKIHEDVEAEKPVDKTNAATK